MTRYACAIFALTLGLNIQPLPAQVQGQWVDSGTLQSTREYHSQVRLSTGEVLAIGGVDTNNNLLASAELYTPAKGAWAVTGSMLQARELFSAVLLTSGKVLVSGGLGTGSAVLAEAELYDPGTGVWSAAGSMNVARLGHTATLLQNGKVLVTGGCTSNSCTTDTAVSELYDPASNTWSATGSLNTARHYQTAVRLKSGAVLVAGGDAGGATNSCELYSVAHGTWSTVASLSVARVFHTTTLLPDGKVLAAGGTVTRFPIRTAELYDPSLNTWTLTGTMITARYGHSATLLTDGTVLLAGGEGLSISCGKACTSYIPTSAAEIYNPAGGAFTATASLNAARAYHSATLLANGRALVDGGSGYSAYCCIVLGSSEVYTPLTMTFSSASLNFGVLQIGLNSAPQTVTVANVSTHPASISSITATGDYSQANTCPGTLNLGQSCAIRITFAPAASGVRTGTVTLKDNDPGNASQTIALTGTGATNAMTLLPATLSFAGQTPGYPSQPLTITLYNDGAATVNITSVAIAPANHTFTIWSNGCPAALSPNTNCPIQVIFTPPDTGNYKAVLSVTDSDKSSPQTASLSGVGLNN